LLVLHVKRYLAALVVLGALCGTYALAVAPWIEPPPIKRRSAPETQEGTGPSPERREWLARLFPADHWARREPKVVETDQCTLLIQDYERLPDGRLILKPCVVIFHSSAEAAAAQNGSQANGRTIVLEAPKAEMSFDKLDVVRGEFGRVQHGRLVGEITIFSPATHDGGRDELHMRTRAVQIDRQRISTLDEVEFRYGDSSGRGRGLTIELLQPEPGQPRVRKSRLGGLQTVTLRQLDYLRVATGGAGLFGDSPAQRSPAGSAPPLEITCRDGLVFDATQQLARFQDNVVVRRLVTSGPADELRCQELLLGFGEPRENEAATSDSSDELAGRLQRIVAIGSPAILEAPSSGSRATAAQLEYSLREKTIILTAAAERQVEQVTLARAGQHLIARELHYQMSAGQKLGQMHAKGPGELRLLQGDAPAQQTIVARWERELQILPQEPNQVISLLGAASVNVDPLGRFAADELHFWVLEAPVAEASSAATGTPADDSNRPPKTTIMPSRLLATGNVQITSPQLDAETKRLETWFINLPPAAPTEERPWPGPIREPVMIQPAAFTPTVPPQAAIRGVGHLPSLQKFHVSGELIRMQLAVRGRQFDLEDLDLRGQAAIDETRTPEAGQQPIRLRGDYLELRHGTTPGATINLIGNPAEVGGRGLSLASGRVEVLRAQNLLRINAPGEATFTAGNKPAPGEPPIAVASGTPGPGLVPAAGFAGQPLHIVWHNGLVFDGLTARFEGDVSLRTDAPAAAGQCITAQTPALVARLSRRLDFQATGGQPQPELAHVMLDGGQHSVYVESRSFDEFSEQISRDQIQARNLAFDRLNGTLHADGPGWVSTVRKGTAGAPGGVTMPGQQQSQPPAPPNPAAAAGANSFTSVHVAFEREIEGWLAQRKVEFRQQVVTTYAPCADFNDVKVADPIMPLAEQMFLMESDTLQATEFVQPANRWFELVASGHTQVRGNKFQVEAPLVSYASDKEVIAVQADGRAKARVFAEQTPGAPPGWIEGQRFTYNLRTGQLTLDRIDNMHFPLPEGLKLPGGKGAGGFLTPQPKQQ
jgi:lipopolysaccharide export system protein LptA